MISIRLLVVFLLLLAGCKPEPNTRPLEAEMEAVPLDYARGFQIYKGKGYWLVKVTQPWAGAEESFRYLILEEGIQAPEGEVDAIISLPINRVVVTSTTHLPHLDALGRTDALIGFPNLDLISSSAVWDRIRSGAIVDLGSAPSANVEMLLELQPDWVMISTLGGDMRQLEVLQDGGIPPLINGEYVEQHPLGRAEWIKFTGVLVGELEAAQGVFEEIKKSYLESISLVLEREELDRPQVLSGIMYEDVWFAPGGLSWGATILEQAGGKYSFADQKGNGSVQLSYEFVLDRALEAPIWIGSADFESLEAMGTQEPRYRSFKSFQEGNVYTYTKKTGPKGGFEYFELGYMRPDLVVKDLIKILHPDLLPDYELYFYTQLHEN